MVFHEPVLDFSVSTLRNDVVDYRRVLRLTTVSGQKLFLAFPDVPPADWLQFVAGGINVFLPSVDFDATYRVLREENPVFVTALDLVGLRAFSLDSGDEPPGEGAGDPEVLSDAMRRARTGSGAVEETAAPTAEPARVSD